MEGDVVKHLELIQQSITRMANHSFLVKGWSITLAAALFALSAQFSNVAFAVVAILPAVSFWRLDAYYLRQERLFRKLYDSVRKPGTALSSFDMSTKEYETSVPKWFRTLWTPSVLGIHGVILVTVAIIIIVLHS